MTMSLRKLQSHIGMRWSSNEGRNDSSWARHLHTVEQPLTDQLQALEKELQTLAAWESNGAISSAERGAQTSRLLASKLPLPDGHGPEALATVQAVDRWKVEGYLSEESSKSPFVAQSKWLRDSVESSMPMMTTPIGRNLTSDFCLPHSCRPFPFSPRQC